MLVSKFIKGAALLAVVAATTLGAGVAAVADSAKAVAPSDSSTQFPMDLSEEFMRNQSTLGELTSWILQQPEVAKSGYIAPVYDATNLAVRLLWHGEDGLLTAALAKAGELGITASVEQRPHSLSEIESIANTLLDAKDSFRAVGFDITAVEGVSADSPDISVLGVPIESERSIAGASGSLDAAQALARALTPSVVTVSTDGADIELTNGSRPDPTPPFWAGSSMERYIAPITDTCTTGFSIMYQGLPRATTARHCDALPYSTPGGAYSYGSSIATSSDGALRVLQATGGPRMFDGPWNVGANTGLDKGLYGLYDVGLNGVICTSGSISGSHCNLKVTNMAVYINDGYGNISTISATQQTTGNSAVAEGDSGGPVFVPYYPPADYNVSAVGIMQAGRDSLGTNCAGVKYAGIECYKTVLFTSMRTALNYLPSSSLLTF